MALTDEEQRLLDLLESSLRSDDPKLAAQFSSAKLGDARPVRPSLGRLVACGVACLAGIGMLVVGMMVAWPVSVAGFVLMLGAVVVAFHASKPGEAPSTGRQSAGQPSGSVKDRMEERWERRQDRERA